MLEAIEQLSGSVGSNSSETVSSANTNRYASEAPAEPATAATAATTAAAAAASAASASRSGLPSSTAPATNGAVAGTGLAGSTRALEEALPGYPLFEIPTSSGAAAATAARACPAVPEVFRAMNVAGGDPFEARQNPPATVVPIKPPADGGKGAATPEEGYALLVSSDRATTGPEGGGGFLVSGVGGAASMEEVEKHNEWKKVLPPRLKPEAESYAALYLATCVRQAMQKSPGQMFR